MFFRGFYPFGDVMSRVIEAVRRIDALNGLIVAVSGGADSVALLLACVEAGLPHLSVAHGNHHLRGNESDDDEQFVRQLAKRLGVPIVVRDLPIPGDSQIEERARDARYQWWAEIANGRLTATAHTADDQAETVLHRIVRGTGIHGLCGIDDRPGFIRPFLRLPKSDLVEFLNDRQQTWRNDSSNTDRRFTRNRLRHDLLPLLAELNPRVSEKMVELAEQAKEWSAFMAKQALELLSASELPRAGSTVILRLESLHGIDEFLTREMVRQLWTRESWPQRDLTVSHWRRLGRLENGNYPGKISVMQAGPVVRIGRVN